MTKFLCSLYLLCVSAASDLYGFDTWPQSTPESQHVDAALLEQAASSLHQRMPTCYSLVIVRHGSLVFERYYSGHTRETADNVKSISKSFLSALTGIAIAEGFLRSTDDRVADYLPEYADLWADTRKRDIRVRHLLTMTAGLDWHDEPSWFAAWYNSGDPQRFTLSRPMLATPGESFNYSTALTHMLSGLLTRATGMSTLDYAATRLFAPAGIQCARWDRVYGTYFGGSEVYFTPRDLAKFGQLYLQRGYMQGRHIVPAAWVDESTSPKVWGFYGYLWWLDEVAGRRVITAAGYGGQYIFIVPTLDLVVVNTAASGEDAATTTTREPYHALENYILPACAPDPPGSRDPHGRPLLPGRMH